MTKFRPVPPLGRMPSGFQPNQTPPVQHPMLAPAPPMNPQQQMAESIEESVQDLAMEIYCRLASEEIRVSRNVGSTSVVNQDALKSLAKNSQAAALAYFQALGVQFEGAPNE